MGQEFIKEKKRLCVVLEIFCVWFDGFLFVVVFSLFCCAFELWAHPGVTWFLPLCCFKIISSFHGNCGMWLSKFQSNFQALLLETVTNCKFVNLKETPLPSCTAVKICMVHLWKWHYLWKGWGLKPWAFHFHLHTTSLAPAKDWGSREEFSLLAASGFSGIWGGTASASYSSRGSVTYRNILSFPRLLWTNLSPLYWDEGWLMLSIHVHNFQWKPVGVRLSQG